MAVTFSNPAGKTRPKNKCACQPAALALEEDLGPVGMTKAAGFYRGWAMKGSTPALWRAGKLCPPESEASKRKFRLIHFKKRGSHV